MPKRVNRTAYTVKQLADLAGVSVRTLHYHDQIELLVPASVGENGYRYYDQDALLRLQQILFFRKLDFRLDEIKTNLDRPDFEVLRALETHRGALKQKSATCSQFLCPVKVHPPGKLFEKDKAKLAASRRNARAREPNARANLLLTGERD